MLKGSMKVCFPIFFLYYLSFFYSNMVKKQETSSVNDITFLPWSHTILFHIIHLQAGGKTFTYPLNEICPGKVEAVSGQKDRINKVPRNITLIRTTTKDFSCPSCPNKSAAVSFLDMEGHCKEVSLPFFVFAIKQNLFLHIHALISSRPCQASSGLPYLSC